MVIPAMRSAAVVEKWIFPRSGGNAIESELMDVCANRIDCFLCNKFENLYRYDGTLCEVTRSNAFAISMNMYEVSVVR